jgi:hypothetical protein
MILDIVLALVISLYLLVDGPRFRARSLSLIPAEHRGKVLFLQDNVSRVLGGYLRAQFSLALIVGVATGIGMALFGLPYAVVLGVLAGLFELVPMFGPILSAVPAVLVALFLPFPTVIWVLLFFLVVQQVENNVLAPRISGHAVGLHPLGAMFALLAGFQLAGLLGGLFAVPVAGVVWVLICWLPQCDGRPNYSPRPSLGPFALAPAARRPRQLKRRPSRGGCPSTADHRGKGRCPLLSTSNVYRARRVECRCRPHSAPLRRGLQQARLAGQVQDVAPQRGQKPSSRQCPEGSSAVISSR